MASIKPQAQGAILINVKAVQARTLAMPVSAAAPAWGCYRATVGKVRDVGAEAEMVGENLGRFQVGKLIERLCSLERDRDRFERHGIETGALLQRERRPAKAFLGGDMSPARFTKSTQEEMLHLKSIPDLIPLRSLPSPTSQR
jgi:hypothetical protein